MPVDSPVLVIVGGFLGSGKTTLLLRAASLLARAGARTALITNDQGGALVDTRLAGAAHLTTEEIVGGCLCCRFSDLIDAAARLRAHRPDVILVEPVGSCIDLAATVLQPLKRWYEADYRLAPFTVLVDPARARELLAPDADPHLAYLFTNQIAEADVVCFSKTDLYNDFPDLPSGFALRLSAETGEGVAEWLSEILAGTGATGGRLLQNVDYERYADAEAALGWLNWQARLDLVQPLSPAQVVGPLLDVLDRNLTESGVAIAHLKLFDDADSGYLKAGICRNGEEPVICGDLAASPAQRHELLINLRACAAPELLRSVVEEAATSLAGEVAVSHLESFRPAAPKPEHRLKEQS